MLFDETALTYIHSVSVMRDSPETVVHSFAFCHPICSDLVRPEIHGAMYLLRCLWLKTRSVCDHWRFNQKCARPDGHAHSLNALPIAVGSASVALPREHPPQESEQFCPEPWQERRLSAVIAPLSYRGGSLTRWLSSIPLRLPGPADLARACA